VEHFEEFYKKLIFLENEETQSMGDKEKIKKGS